MSFLLKYKALALLLLGITGGVTATLLTNNWHEYLKEQNAHISTLTQQNADLKSQLVDRLESEQLGEGMVITERQKEQEAVEPPKDRTATQPTPLPQPDLAQKVAVELVNLGPSEREGGLTTTLSATMKLKLINNTNKHVSAVKGEIIFNDIFGDRIGRHFFNYEGGIPVKGHALVNETIYQGIYKNVTKTSQYQFIWSPTHIVYQDGSKDTK